MASATRGTILPTAAASLPQASCPHILNRAPLIDEGGPPSRSLATECLRDREFLAFFILKIIPCNDVCRAVQAFQQ